MAQPVTTWVLEQLGGPRKKLFLDGWSAPFGRPRQEAIVRDSIEIREAEVYYPGNEDGPTRHLFGRKYPERELHGRFRDRAFSPGYAKAKTAEVKKFVADQQRVRIAWSDVLSETGLITKFDPGRESEGEVEWTLTYKVDVDNFDRNTPNVPDAKTPPDYSSAVFAAMQAMLAPTFRPPGELVGSILDAIDSVVSAVTTAVGALQNVADSISSFEKATFSQLNRLVNAVGGVRNAVRSFEETYLYAQNETALLRENADSQVSLWSGQTTADDAVRAMLAETSDLERKSVVTIEGKIRSTYVARSGDTWESISVQFYGDPSRAGDLRAANGNSEVPVPGVVYRIPK